MRILRLTKSGLPLAWVSREEAATLYVKGQVLWSIGDNPSSIYGGVNPLGERSCLTLSSIIACDGDTRKRNFVPALTNRLLFRRDDYRCMYCGYEFDESHHSGALTLTRDHIRPRVQGGRDVWTNVISACSRCNHHKGGRTPEQARMELLAIPFEPNVFEFMYLANRHIRGDQMQYLQARFSGQRYWQAA